MYFELKRLSLDNPGILEVYRQECSLGALFREVSCTKARITEGRDGEDHPARLSACTGLLP